MLTAGQDISMEPIDKLDELAGMLFEASEGRKVWLFEGGLGAGKTTLIKHLCDRLGVQEAVQSPTFSLVNEYAALQGETVYHFDLYRLKSAREAYEIGIEEYLDSGHFCFIEWPGVADPIWPDDVFRLRLHLDHLGKRVITLLPAKIERSTIT